MAHHPSRIARAAGAGALIVVFVRPLPAAETPRSREPVTHEAIWLMKRVGSPVVSPDGRWAVFSVTEPAYEEKKEVVDLWIVPVDGSAPARRLTSAKGSESGPAWSPESRRIAFSAKRDDDDVSQIYVLDLGGGESQRITSSPLAARGACWSPDGRSIAYEAGSYPGADEAANRKIVAEKKDAKSKVRTFDRFPIRRWDRWLDEVQTHLFVVPAEGGASRDLLAGTKLVSEAGFGGAGGEGSGESL